MPRSMGSWARFHQSPATRNGVIDGIPNMLVWMVAHAKPGPLYLAVLRINGYTHFNCDFAGCKAKNPR